MNFLELLELIVKNQTGVVAAVTAVGVIAMGVVSMVYNVYSHAKKSWNEIDGGPEKDSLRVIVERIDGRSKEITEELILVRADQKAQDERIKKLEGSPIH